MDIDHNFLVEALTVIRNGALAQTGKIGLEQGLKSVQPYVQGIWAFIQNKPQSEAIAELKTNTNIQSLVAELAKLIEDNPELLKALKEAIASEKYTIEKQINIDQSGKHNTQTNNISL